MIVCVCKAISDRQLRASIEAGNNTFDALQFEHGVASCCGRCEDAVHDVLEGREIGCTRRTAGSPAGANSPMVSPVVFYTPVAA